MEPLSIVASFIAVIDISSKVITICYRYRGAVKNAPRDLLRVQNEVTGFRSIVERLHQLVIEDPQSQGFPTLEKQTGPDGPLAQCLEELESLKRRLEPETGWRAAGKALMWPLREGDAVKSLDFIGRVKQTLQLALLADNAANTIVIRESTRDLAHIRQGINTLTAKLEHQKQNTEFREVMAWLGAPQSTNHVTARKRRAPDTGDWLLVSPDYIHWMKTSGNVLWLHGTSGCGKTVLFSKIVDAIKVVCDTGHSTAIAYHYFDFNDKRRNLAESVVRTWLTQLCGQSIELPERLRSEYERRSYLSDTGTAIVDTLEEILRTLILKFEHVYLLLDALDECSDPLELEQVQAILERIRQSSPSRVHVLATSQYNRDLQDYFENAGATRINLLDTELAKDIGIYVRSRLRDDLKLKRQPPDVQNEVELTLVNNSQGSFRWVACQINALKRCTSTAALRNALHSLPNDLPQTYIRMFHNIDSINRCTAIKILKWASFSFRPLNLHELCEALAIDLDSNHGPRYDPELRLWDPLDVFTICPGLVTIVVHATKDSNNLLSMDQVEVRLSHFTVKEFLTSPLIQTGPWSDFALSQPSSQIFLAQSCLTYLLYIDEPLTEINISYYSLAHYAAAFWIEHVKLFGPLMDQVSLRDLMRRLMNPGSVNFANWTCLFQVDAPWRKPSFSGFQTAAEPLYYMSYLGFEDQVEALLEDGSDPNNEGGLYGTALQAAAFQGWTRIVELLLGANARPEIEKGVFDYPLIAAVSQEHEQIVRLLLESGASPNLDARSFRKRGPALLIAANKGNKRLCELLLSFGADANYYAPKADPHSALEAAVSKGHIDIVKLLLEQPRRGADFCDVLKESSLIASRNGAKEIFEALVLYGLDKRPALRHAAYIGDKVILQKLIDSGADLNHQGGYSFEEETTPLLSAIVGGHLEIVRTLLDQGADPYQKTSFANVLAAAAKGGNLEVVKLFLDLKLPINVGSHSPLCPLGCAAEEGHLDVLKILIDSGGDINYNHGEALQRAAYHRHVEIVRELLSRKANVNLENQFGQTALYHAASGGSALIVKMLIDHGALINHHGGRDGNSLHAGIEAGHLHIVQILLDHGADIEQQWKRSGATDTIETPLIHAARRGNEAIVRELLARDADVNPCLEGATTGGPLLKAIKSGHSPIAFLLLDHGAEVNVSGTPVVYAVQNKMTTVLEALLDRGADINAHGKYWRDEPTFPLKLAAQQGDMETVQLLLDHGANVNEQDVDGFTTLHMAASRGNEALLRRLIYDYKADLGVQLRNGSLPIHSAASEGHKTCVELLIDAGANIDALNKEDRTPLHWAAESGHWDTVEFLVERGARVGDEDENGLKPLDLAELCVRKYDYKYYREDLDIWTDEKVQALFKKLVANDRQEKCQIECKQDNAVGTIPRPLD